MVGDGVPRDPPPIAAPLKFDFKPTDAAGVTGSGTVKIVEEEVAGDRLKFVPQDPQNCSPAVTS
jgi:hypothetical protein